MSSVPSPDEELRERILLLRETTELLMWELSAISERRWESLPELKTKKSCLQERLLRFDWSVGPGGEDSDDVLMLKSQIADLEKQSSRKIAMRLQMIRGQLNSLRRQQQTWLECVQGYLKKSPELVATP